jgi:hypothetical protein
MSVGGNSNCDRNFDQTGPLAPIGLCRAIDLGDALSRKARVDLRGDLFIRKVGRPSRPLYHPLSAGHQCSELDLGSAAETLLRRPIFHLQWETECVQTGVHRFVKNRRGDFCVAERRVHGEGQLHQTGALLVEVCPPTREALHDDVREISLEMPEMVRYVAFDQGQTAFQAPNDGAGVDVGPRIVHEHGNPEHLMPGGAGWLATPGEHSE